MSKGRIVGAAVAMVSVVGLVVVCTLPKNPVYQMSRLSLAHKSLMKAFSKRSLAELKQLNAMVSFTAMQEGQSMSDAGLSIHATIESDPEKADKPQVEVEFYAQEGKGEDLKEVLAKIVKASQEAEMLPPDAFTFESTDDTAKSVFVPPVDEDEEFANDMEEGMNKVKFESSLKLGRTLDELYDDQEEHLPMSLHGIQISAQ